MKEIHKECMKLYLKEWDFLNHKSHLIKQDIDIIIVD